MASYDNAYTDISLAEATLTDEDRDNGWKVGFSEREKRAYFYNPVTCVTQWECPADGVIEAATPSQAPPTLEQTPTQPKFPNGLIPPPKPVAANHVKDIVDLATIEALGNTPSSSKRTNNEVSNNKFMNKDISTNTKNVHCCSSNNSNGSS